MIQDYSREFPCNMFTWYGALYCHFVFIIITVTSSMFCLEQITVSKYLIIYSVALNEFIASEVIIVEIVFNPQAASPAAGKQRRWSQWLRSELCVSFKACNPMPRVVCRSIVSAIMSWAWEFMCIRTLSPQLFILVLEALSHEFSIRVLWELLRTDDLLLITNTQEECISKLKAWKAWYRK